MAGLLARLRNHNKSGRNVCGALLLALLLPASGPWCQVFPQGAGCSDACKAAFGACYKSTANRAACEQQMQRCLEGCIVSKRG